MMYIWAKKSLVEVQVFVDANLTIIIKFGTMPHYQKLALDIMYRSSPRIDCIFFKYCVLILVTRRLSCGAP